MQVTQDVSRRTYSSAAMLGVALSVGACGIFAPHQGDAAMAAEKGEAESLAAEPNLTSAFPPGPSSVEASSVSVIASALPVSHTVQEGESLSQIANLHGLSPTRVATLNRLELSAVLRVGQVIALGSPEGRPVPNLTESSVASNVRTVAKVRQDDAITKLKEQQSRLKKSLAELRPEASEASLVASLPTPALSTDLGSIEKSDSLKGNFSSHQIVPGENLSTIARSHGMSLQELALLNQIKNPDLVKVNQVIRVPQVKPVSVIAPPSRSQSVAIAVPSLGVGGSSAAMTRSLQAPTTPSHTPSRADDNRRYVDHLLADVVKLRQKYRSSALAYRSTSSSFKESVVEPTIANDRRVFNPEFQSTPVQPTLVPATSAARVQKVVNSPSLPQVSSYTAPRIIARASVGADAYAPLVQKSARRMVSPQMPTIGSSESYLPSGKAAMKGYIWPAEGALTSGYGQRWGRMHRGIDVAAPVGTPIVAAAPGVVSFSGWNDGGYGYLVEVDHADGSMTRYAHNSRLLVSSGQTVGQGQQISEMGSTGFSTGPHLHFEIHPSGQGAVNPMAFLPNDRG